MNFVVMTARVCFKRMVELNKPGSSVLVVDFVNDMKVKFGFTVTTEITSKILLECSAVSFMHSGEVQLIRDNRPEEVPEFAVFCNIHCSDLGAFPGIVAHGNSTTLVFDPALALRHGKAQYAELARQVASGASVPVVESANQSSGHDGGGQAFVANIVPPLSARLESRARPAGFKDNDPAAFGAPPNVQASVEEL